jgi:hypothetical protein
MPDQNPTIKRVRAVLYDRTRRTFLAVVNNRVEPGCLTIMLPGGDLAQDEGQLDAIVRHVRDQVGVSFRATEGSCRFLLSRTYEFKDEVAQISFYLVEADGCVPRNQIPESAVSVSWMTLADATRLCKDENWKIQLGAMDALKAAFGDKTEQQSGAREVSRETPAPSSKPSSLPYESVSKK